MSDTTETVFTTPTDTTETVFTTPTGKISRYDFRAPVLHSVMATLVLITCIFGLVGNSFCAIVLKKMEKSGNNMKFLKYLTYVDIILLILGYVDFSMSFIDPSFNMMDIIRNGLLPFIHPLALTVYTVEIYLTVLIALQRTMAVARPLHPSSLSKDSFQLKVIIWLVIFASGFNIPHWIAYPPELYWEPWLNSTWLKNDVSQFGRSYGYREVYSGYATLVVRTVIPMLTLIVANVVIVLSIRRNAGKRRSMTTGQGESKTGQVTGVILAITSMSLVTHFMSASVRILITIWQDDITIAKEAFITSSTLFIIINSSSNFIFYCTFGKNFRENLKTLCRK